MEFNTIQSNNSCMNACDKAPTAHTTIIQLLNTLDKQQTFAMDIFSMVLMNTVPFNLLLTASAKAADEQRSLTRQKLLKYSNCIPSSISLNKPSNDS